VWDLSVTTYEVYDQIYIKKSFGLRIQFRFICIVLFTIHIVSNQPFLKISILTAWFIKKYGILFSALLNIPTPLPLRNTRKCYIWKHGLRNPIASVPSEFL